MIKWCGDVRDIPINRLSFALSAIPIERLTASWPLRKGFVGLLIRTFSPGLSERALYVGSSRRESSPGHSGRALLACSNESCLPASLKGRRVSATPERRCLLVSPEANYLLGSNGYCLLPLIAGVVC
jgi:hypothetical protein